MTVPAVYVMSLEPESGKSLVTFGVMEAAAAATGRVGYFRPVIAAGPEPDRVIEVSRMLSGTPGSSTVQDAATELLTLAATERGR